MVKMAIGIDPKQTVKFFSGNNCQTEKEVDFPGFEVILVIHTCVMFLVMFLLVFMGFLLLFFHFCSFTL